ncbi:hypothetical protein [Vibrio phage VCPH]|nr:hypothetical protein [Vibrio phage VCPH]
MTNQQYLMMCEQMGIEPDVSKLAKNLGDFPLIVQIALKIYSKLPDLMVPLGMEGSVFGGKDYTNLMNVCKIYNVSGEYELFIILEVCEHLEANRLEKERAALERKRRQQSK